jgi:uncharacterized protein (TIGR03067 family)
MKIRALLPVLSLAAVMAAFAADKPDDATNIQGSWRPVEAQLRGQPMKEEVLKIVTLKLDAGKYFVTAESPDKGTYTINAAAKPKTLDITGVEGPNAGKKILAIYELNGDTLRLCYGRGGGPRPTEFKSTKDSPNFLVTYKRKKP